MLLPLKGLSQENTFEYLFKMDVGGIFSKPSIAKAVFLLSAHIKDNMTWL